MRPSGGLSSTQGLRGTTQSAEVPDFIPGKDGNLYWNTTVPVDEKPVLVYLYNGHVVDDNNAKFCKDVETSCFNEKRIVKVARDFACEKICYGCEELIRPVPHRDVLEKYMANVTQDKKKKAPAFRIVLLDSKGQTLKEFKRPPTPAALLAAMKKAREENAQRLKFDDGGLSG